MLLQSHSSAWRRAMFCRGDQGRWCIVVQSYS
jgi:hypothetical protein